MPQYRAVLFDAVGTLLHPEPAAGLVYAEAGRRFESRLTAEAITARFRTAFHRQEEADRAAGLRTDEGRERERWRAIVAEVLDDVADGAGCFQHLYEHFTRPTAWRVEPGAGPVLKALAERGVVLGMASNFDHRLRGVVAGFAELAPLRHLVISSEVTWRKPAPGFFAAACSQLALPAEEILIVGDDPANDLEGARAAGMPALLYDPRGRASISARVVRLEELLTLSPPSTAPACDPGPSGSRPGCRPRERPGGTE